MGSPFWAIVLLSVALVLFFAEVFIPSGGMILATAFICIILSIWSAGNVWWNTNPLFFWMFVGVAVVLVPVSLSSAIALWPYTPLGKRAEPPSLEEVTPYLEEQRRLEKLIGQLGVTDTPLNPGGIVRIQGERIHCRSEGMVLPAGASVSILSVSGNNVTVREVPAKGDHSQTPKNSHNSKTIPPSDESSVDFELPNT